MKKVLGAIVLSSMSIVACSNSSDKGSGTPAGLISSDKVVIKSLSGETSITNGEYDTAKMAIKNCDGAKFDPNFRGVQVREKSSFSSDSGSGSHISTSRISNVTDTRVEMDVVFETYEVSMLPGVQIYKDNKAQNICTMKSYSEGFAAPRCEMEGEYTQAVKDYIAAQQKQDRTEDEKCESVPQSSEDKSTVKYSKGVYRLQSGRNINVFVVRSEYTYEQKCEKRGRVIHHSVDVNVVSFDMKTTPERTSCTMGATIANDHQSQDGSNQVRHETYELLEIFGR